MIAGLPSGAGGCGHFAGGWPEWGFAVRGLGSGHHRHVLPICLGLCVVSLHLSQLQQMLKNSAETDGRCEPCTHAPTPDADRELQAPLQIVDQPWACLALQQAHTVMT